VPLALARWSVLACGLVGVAGFVLRVWPAVIVAGLTGGVLVFCAGWVAFEVTAGDERRQVLWIVSGVCFAAATITIAVLADPVSGSGFHLVTIVFTCLVSLVVPVALGLALVRPRAYDVRVAISRTVVQAVMLALATSVFAAGVSGYRVLVGSDPPIGAMGILVTVIAALYHPVLLQARGTLDELLFGGRVDPVDTLTRLGTQLTSGTSPEEWLHALRVALAVPGLVLRSDGEDLVASGTITGRATESTALRSGTAEVGELVVALPGEQLRLPAATRAVLALVAPPVAQALHAVRLTEQLQASRGRVVAALEEERRRMRRDLHDGLGPTLTGIAYSADAAANLSGTDPDQAAAVLAGLRRDAAEAITEIRRIVYGLRPRALDEFGLVAAVAHQLDRLRSADGTPLTVVLSAPVTLPELPAAVEVVAYRVAVEAVTNVARHAAAREARVGFTVVDGDQLQVTVDDDGPGEARWEPGIGLESMRERVEQIGGWLEAGPRPAGGQVRATIPLLVG
jgi:signal transduction histidine kinase